MTRQLTFDYQLYDDHGISQIENVPMLLQVGTIFKHEYGTYEVERHAIGPTGQIVPICERIDKKGL